VVLTIYKFGQMEKIEKLILCGLDRGTLWPIPLWAHASLQNLIEAQQSATREQGNSARADGSPVRLDTGVQRRLEGPAPKLSLSPPAIEIVGRLKLSQGRTRSRLYDSHHEKWPLVLPLWLTCVVLSGYFPCKVTIDLNLYYTLRYG
jgi:hypothetical protein